MRSQALRLLSLLSLLSLGSLPVLAADPPDTLALLPEADPAGAWKPLGPAERFQGQKLFDYMNGGAELFLAYGFDELGVRPYQVGALPVRAAVYRMGSPAEAFGIHAFNLKGPPVDVGGPASLAHGMLSFFRGRYYVRVTAEGKAAEPDAALVALGKALYARLPGDSQPPAEVGLLPPGALDGSLRFLTHPETSRTVFFEGEGEALLPRGARAALALYPGQDGDLQLVRAAYPSAEEATRARQALTAKLGLKALPQDGGASACGQGPDGTFHLLSGQGALLRWVGGAKDDGEARAWLAKIP